MNWVLGAMVLLAVKVKHGSSFSSQTPSWKLYRETVLLIALPTFVWGGWIPRSSTTFYTTTSSSNPYTTSTTSYTNGGGTHYTSFLPWSSGPPTFVTSPPTNFFSSESSTSSTTRPTTADLTTTQTTTRWTTPHPTTTQTTTRWTTPHPTTTQTTTRPTTADLTTIQTTTWPTTADLTTTQTTTRWTTADLTTTQTTTRWTTPHPTTTQTTTRPTTADLTTTQTTTGPTTADLTTTQTTTGPTTADLTTTQTTTKPTTAHPTTTQTTTRPTIADLTTTQTTTKPTTSDPTTTQTTTKPTTADLTTTQTTTKPTTADLTTTQTTTGPTTADLTTIQTTTGPTTADLTTTQITTRPTTADLTTTKITTRPTTADLTTTQTTTRPTTADLTTTQTTTRPTTADLTTTQTTTKPTTADLTTTKTTTRPTTPDLTTTQTTTKPTTADLTTTQTTTRPTTPDLTTTQTTTRPTTADLTTTQTTTRPTTADLTTTQTTTKPTTADLTTTQTTTRPTTADLTTTQTTTRPTTPDLTTTQTTTRPTTPDLTTTQITTKPTTADLTTTQTTTRPKTPDLTTTQTTTRPTTADLATTKTTTKPTTADLTTTQTTTRPTTPDLTTTQSTTRPTTPDLTTTQTTTKPIKKEATTSSTSMLQRGRLESEGTEGGTFGTETGTASNDAGTYGTQGSYGTGGSYGSTQGVYGTTQGVYRTTQGVYGTTQGAYGTTQGAYGTTGGYETFGGYETPGWYKSFQPEPVVTFPPPGGYETFGGYETPGWYKSFQPEPVVTFPPPGGYETFGGYETPGWYKSFQPEPVVTFAPPGGYETPGWYKSFQPRPVETFPPEPVKTSFIPWGTSEGQPKTYQTEEATQTTSFDYVTGTMGTTPPVDGDDSPIEMCGVYVVITASTVCRSIDITGDYKAVKFNSDLSKVIYIKEQLNSEDEHDYKTRLIMDKYAWYVYSGENLIAFTTNTFEDGTLCFPGDFTGSLSWTITCEDGSQISTIPLSFETYTSSDDVIIGAVYQDSPVGESCLTGPKGKVLEVNAFGDSATDSLCLLKIEGKYEYRGGTYAGFPLYEHSSDSAGKALFYSTFMGGYIFGYPDAFVNIMAVEVDALMEPDWDSPMTRDICPTSLSEMLFVCGDRTPIAPISVSEQTSGFSFTVGLNPKPAPLAYKDNVFSSMRYNIDDVRPEGFMPFTPAMEARSTPIFPATGANNRRWCRFTTLTIEDFGGGCGLSVNGDYSFGGDFAGFNAVYEKIAPWENALPNEKVYLYYIKNAHRWVLGTGFLDGTGLIASFRHEGECPYARGVEEMKIEESGFCTDLVVGDKFDARLTGQSYSASAGEDGFPTDADGTFIVSIYGVTNYNMETPGISPECKETGIAFQGLYKLGDSNKVMGGRRVYYKLLVPIEGQVADEEHFLWYSLSHKVWIINSIIGEFNEPLIYAPYNYEGGYEFLPLIEKSWFLKCDGVNSLTSLSIFTLPEPSTGPVFETTDTTQTAVSTEVPVLSTTDGNVVEEDTSLVIDIVTIGEENVSKESALVIDIVTEDGADVDLITVVTSSDDKATAKNSNDQTTAPNSIQEKAETNKFSDKALVNEATREGTTVYLPSEVTATTKISSVVTTESNFIPPVDEFEPEPFLPMYNRLSASFVFDGEYCRRSAERKAVKRSFKDWDVFAGTCYQNGDCPSSSLRCIEENVKKEFVVEITFKQQVDPVTGSTEGLIELHDLIAILQPGTVVLTIQTNSRKREAIQFSMEETTAEDVVPVCPKGSVSENNVCDWCLNGTYQSGNSCIDCGVDEYQDEVGQTECLVCEAGFSTDGLAGQSVCVKDGVLEELEEAVSGLSTVTLAVIAAVAAFLVVVIVVVTVCIVKKKNNKRGKLQSRVSPTPGQDNLGYLNSQTSVRHH
ncbi:hypothetical protein ACHWQZ_G000749 [Mnemiopsis leidyi]